MTRATINPPDLEIKGASYLFMSFPRSFASLADLIHLFVRKRVRRKLKSSISPARISSSGSANIESKKMDTRLSVRRVDTTDVKGKNVKTVICITSVLVLFAGFFLTCFKMLLYA